MNNPMECSVCYDKYNESVRRPRSLHCGHCFCTLCLGNMLSAGVGNMLRAGRLLCPTCRVAHQASNVTQIPINYTVEALLKIKVSEPTQTPATASIGRRLQPLLKDQKDSTEKLMPRLEKVQSQLDQYSQQLDGWMAEHLQQMDTLSDLMEQHKVAVQLLQQENNKVMDMKNKGEKRKKEMKSALEKLQTVNTAQEMIMAINNSEHCNKEAEKWKGKRTHFPSIYVVNTSLKVRGITRTTLKTLFERKGAEQDGHSPRYVFTAQEEYTLTIANKVNKLTQQSPTVLVEDMRWVLEGGAAVCGVQQDQGYHRCSRVTLHQGKVYLHSLLDQPPPLHAYTLPVSEVLQFVDLSSTVTFLDLAWGGSTIGRVHIRLRPNNTLATQFMLLCTGQDKHSYINTKLLKVVWKGESRECVAGGDYQYNTGEGGAPLLNHTVEKYKEPCNMDTRYTYDLFSMPCRTGTVWSRYEPNSDLSAQFMINTRDHNVNLSYVFGNVESGLEVLREAVNHTDIKEVTVVDCGVVLCL